MNLFYNHPHLNSCSWTCVRISEKGGIADSFTGQSIARLTVCWSSRQRKPQGAPLLFPCAVKMWYLRTENVRYDHHQAVLWSCGISIQSICDMIIIKPMHCNQPIITYSAQRVSNVEKPLIWEFILLATTFRWYPRIYWLPKIVFPNTHYDVWKQHQSFIILLYGWILHLCLSLFVMLSLIG